MDLEKIKSKLAIHRATGRREIPEDIWRDAVKISQQRGAGTVGKLLGLSSVRIKHWAAKFGEEIPFKGRRKPRPENAIIRVAEVTFKSSVGERISQEEKKILELKAANGLSLSFFESVSGEQFEKFLHLVKEVL